MNTTDAAQGFPKKLGTILATDLLIQQNCKSSQITVILQIFGALKFR